MPERWCHFPFFSLFFLQFRNQRQHFLFSSHALSSASHVLSSPPPPFPLPFQRIRIGGKRFRRRQRGASLFLPPPLFLPPLHIEARAAAKSGAATYSSGLFVKVFEFILLSYHARAPLSFSLFFLFPSFSFPFFL